MLVGEEERTRQRELEAISVIEEDEENGGEEGVGEQVRGLCDGAEDVQQLLHHVLLHDRDDLGMSLIVSEHVLRDGERIQNHEGMEEEVEVGRNKQGLASFLIITTKPWRYVLDTAHCIDHGDKILQ